jgi:hypothetical protein
MRAGSYARTYKPQSYHIAQELQKYNIPDYRPRQEQYVLAHFRSCAWALTRVQVPEGDQEGARGTTHAPEPRIRVQPDRDGRRAGPGAAHPRVRHVQVARAAVRVLVRSCNGPGLEHMIDHGACSVGSGCCPTMRRFPRA